ncbi:MAG: NADH-quinone oxidoreductase subunit M [Bdellovibrionales bacterium]|nr:NADH-quinone oxidoreductase subunit M [Bdellovibrionales bacterium]
MEHILTYFIFFPVFMAFLLGAVPPQKTRWIYRIALLSTIFHMLWLFLLVSTPEIRAGQWFWVESMPWIDSLYITYSLGMDGLSALMCLLTSVVFVSAVMMSHKIQKRQKAYFILLMLLLTGIYGVFLSMDFFLFYIFWELALIPLYFLIGIWGGQRREYAAIKFFIYTMVGSVFLLLGLILVYYFNPLELPLDWANLPMHQTWILASVYSIWDIPLPVILFFCFFIAFAIKVPIFPFHTWLPDAHVQAPTPISMILAGILLKIGMYGLFRVMVGFVPVVVLNVAPTLFILGLINLIYGAFCAMYQKDFKKLIAYSSISHMGFCIIGLASFSALSLQGSVMQMVSHGLIAAMLFLIAGSIYERTYSLTLSDLGGLAATMPKLTWMGVFAVFASIGLPGLFGFVSEFLVLAGSFMGHTSPHAYVGSVYFFQIGSAIALVTLLIGAVYMLWTLQRVFFGPAEQKWALVQDINNKEFLVCSVLAILIVWFGVFPSVLLEMPQTSILQWLDWIGVGS